MNLSFWRLGWRTLWRDLRSGDLRLVIVAVALAVAALTAVGFFADRLKGGLQRDARQLLGGDAVSSDTLRPQCLRTRQRAAGCPAEARWVFRRWRVRQMAGRGIKLVAPGGGGKLPLAWQPVVATSPDAPRSHAQIPTPGQAWVTRPCWKHWASKLEPTATGGQPTDHCQGDCGGA